MCNRASGDLSDLSVLGPQRSYMEVCTPLQATARSGATRTISCEEKPQRQNAISALLHVALLDLQRIILRQI